MATVIQGQGVTPNAIGRGFGSGLGKALEDRLEKQKQMQRFEGLAQVLGKVPDQFGGQENVTLLADILSKNPSAIPQVLSSIKSEKVLGQEAEEKRLKEQERRAKIAETIFGTKEKGARANKLKKETELLGQPKPKTKEEKDLLIAQKNLANARTRSEGQPKTTTKRVAGTNKNGQPMIGTPDEIREAGGKLGNPTVEQQKINQFGLNLTKSSGRADIVDQDGVLPNISSYQGVVSGKENTANLRMRSIFYPKTVITNSQGKLIPNPEVPKALIDLSNVSTSVYKEAFQALVADKSIPANLIPESDELMSRVVNHFKDLENRISGSADEAKLNTTPEDKKLLSSNPKSLKAEALKFVSSLKEELSNEVVSTGGTSSLLDRANQSATPTPSNPTRGVKVHPYLSTALNKGFDKNKFDRLIENQKGKGKINEDKANRLKQEYSILLEGLKNR